MSSRHGNEDMQKCSCIPIANLCQRSNFTGAASSFRLDENTYAQSCSCSNCYLGLLMTCVGPVHHISNLWHPYIPYHTHAYMLIHFYTHTRSRRLLRGERCSLKCRVAATGGSYPAHGESVLVTWRQAESWEPHLGQERQCAFSDAMVRPLASSRLAL